jgi:hypothetical protein
MDLIHQIEDHGDRVVIDPHVLPKILDEPGSCEISLRELMRAGPQPPLLDPVLEFPPAEFGSVGGLVIAKHL